ncbi:MAG: hypothetical protein JXB62_16255 [Pirellulales bacterium]|nr:hypothetical protein [Pirellulales bacterium]
MRLAVTAVVLWPVFGSGPPLSADTSGAPSANVLQATTSQAARQSAIQSIPIEKLDPQARAKVRSVLSDIAVFRRLPVRVIDCDPHLYLFLVRNPDVVVNIWEVLKVSSLQLRQVRAGKYRVAESAGTLATVEFLYGSHDTHVIYAEGSYDGPLFARPIKGRCLMVLRSGYVREPNGRYYITTRLDTFISVDHGGAELLTKTFHPLVGKTADLNFVQTVAFLGSLSRTAEVNSRGVQRLASKLSHVAPEARLELAELAADIAQKTTASADRETASSPQVASRGGTAGRD